MVSPKLKNDASGLRLNRKSEKIPLSQNSKSKLLEHERCKNFEVSCESVSRERQINGRITSVASGASPSVLAREVDFGMHDTHVPCQCVIATECLLLDAQSAADLRLADVVNRVFVTGQVVWSREHGIAGLARGRVDAITTMRTALTVASEKLCGGHPATDARRG